MQPVTIPAGARPQQPPLYPHPVLLRESAAALKPLPTNWGEICKQVVRAAGKHDHGR